MYEIGERPRNVYSCLRPSPPPCLKLGGLGASLAPKIDQNGSKIDLGGCLGASWRALGAILAPGGPQEPTRPPNSHKSYTQVTPSWGPFGRFWEPCWSYVGILIFCSIFDRFWKPLGRDFGGFWTPSWKPSWPKN